MEAVSTWEFKNGKNVISQFRKKEKKSLNCEIETLFF